MYTSYGNNPDAPMLTSEQEHVCEVEEAEQQARAAFTAFVADLAKQYAWAGINLAHFEANAMDDLGDAFFEARQKAESAAEDSLDPWFEE